MFIGGAARKLLRVLVPGVAVGLLDDVLAWSAGLPAWQRDALRRLFRNGQLGPADLVELTTLIKEEHGDGTVSSVRPTPLVADDIPAGGTTAVSVQLLAINNLLNVHGSQRADPWISLRKDSTCFSGRTVRENPDMRVS